MNLIYDSYRVKISNTCFQQVRYDFGEVIKWFNILFLLFTNNNLENDTMIKKTQSFKTKYSGSSITFTSMIFSAFWSNFLQSALKCLRWSVFPAFKYFIKDKTHFLLIAGGVDPEGNASSKVRMISFTLTHVVSQGSTIKNVKEYPQ